MSYLRAFWRGTLNYLGRSEIASVIITQQIKQRLPQLAWMGYEKRPNFILINYPKWASLPTINVPTQAQAKVEYHQAHRAGDHLDLRILINGRSYDFAIVKRTDFPKRSGELQKIVVRNNHSLHYFNTDKHEFPEGTYGWGKMETVWRGSIDILFCNKEKIEFEIFDGPYKGRYCLRTEKSPQIPGTIQRMKDEEFVHRERRPFTNSKPAQLRAETNSDIYIAEEKIDGANYTLIPGPKANGLYSRRLSVTGEPINRSANIPQLRYFKFPKFLHGKRIHVEVVDQTHSSSKTAGLLNAYPMKSRYNQIKDKNFLQLYVWDYEFEGTYEERRAQYKTISRLSPRRDNRFFGVIEDRFLIQRMTNPRIIQYVEGSDDLNLTPIEYSEIKKNDGSEGTVWKHKYELYDSSEPWTKKVNGDKFDLVIVDMIEGQGKHTGRLGALVVESSDGIKTKVGTGFSDEERNELWDNKNNYIGKRVEVMGLEIASKGAVRAPRFHSHIPD